MEEGHRQSQTPYPIQPLQFQVTQPDHLLAPKTWGYQLLYIRAKCAALRRGDLPEARSIGQRMAAAGLPGVGEEERNWEGNLKTLPIEVGCSCIGGIRYLWAHVRCKRAWLEKHTANTMRYFT